MYQPVSPVQFLADWHQRLGFAEQSDLWQYQDFRSHFLGSSPDQHRQYGRWSWPFYLIRPWRYNMHSQNMINRRMKKQLEKVYLPSNDLEGRQLCGS